MFFITGIVRSRGLEQNQAEASTWLQNRLLSRTNRTHKERINASTQDSPISSRLTHRPDMAPVPGTLLLQTEYEPATVTNLIHRHRYLKQCSTHSVTEGGKHCKAKNKTWHRLQGMAHKPHIEFCESEWCTLHNQNTHLITRNNG